jgi:beta-glucanase (GH16 family)
LKTETLIMRQKKINVLATLFGICLVSFLLFACSKKGSSSNPPPSIPALSIQDVAQARASTGTVMKFYVSSNSTSTNAVSVDYSLVSGTAVSPRDFVSVSGTVSIPANQNRAEIDVQINGDTINLRQPNLQFTVQLSNPKLCTIGTASAKGTIITENGTYLPTDTSGYTTPLSYPGYTLAWSDEFSEPSLDLNVWNQEIGNGSGGWGNNELEYYTNNPKNVFLSNGNLIIEARSENVSGFNYTSSRLTTQNKKNFKFGRIDIRAKLPVGKGIWPALWMLGANINSVSWPACGEMDLMELIGTFPGRIYGTMHWQNAGGNHDSKGTNYNLSSGDFSQQFHVFSTMWKQDSIKCYVDDQLYLTVTSADVGAANYPFNANQFFIFNVAVGGNWPGSPDGSTVFPERMFVDYVRVFQ